MITSLQLLSPEECTRLDGTIKELRDCWIQRGNPQTSFFTLGAASYLDDPAEYPAVARRLNPLLIERFGWVYERLVDLLGRRLRAPVTFAEGLGHPGFHIWGTSSIFTTPVASVHFDLQYLRTWPENAPGVDFDRPLSFTLAIRLPQRGGGLNIWDVTYDRYVQFRRRLDARLVPADLAVLLPPMRHPYTVGAVAMHSGLMLHQIGEIDQVFPGDERITLQGHALWCRGAWQLYW